MGGCTKGPFLMIIICFIKNTVKYFTPFFPYGEGDCSPTENIF